MKTLKQTPFYKKVIHELNYSFGNYYLYNGYVIAEINEDVIYSWENHGKIVTQDILKLYENNGSELVYITNRVNNYSVKPTGWLHFFKNSHSLKGYGIVSYNKIGFHNGLLEKLFLKTNMVRFNDLENAIFWAEEVSTIKAIAS